MMKLVSDTAVTEASESSKVTSNASDSDIDTEINEDSIAERYKALFSSWEKLMEINMRLKGDKAKKFKRLRV